MKTDYFNGLCDQLGARPDRRGEVHVDCPICGREADAVKTHFSFSRRGAHCFVCGFSASLERFYEIINDLPDATERMRLSAMRRREAQVERVAKAVDWKAGGIGLVNRYMQHPDTVSFWQQYKFLAEDTIRKYRFGLGVLPDLPYENPRLIVPVFGPDGELAGLHGRAPRHAPMRITWRSARGSSKLAFGLDRIEPGCILWIVENYADAALMEERHDGWVSIALGTARKLRDEEMAVIVANRPSKVVVAFDNDLVGQARGAMLERLRREWIEEFRRRNPQAKTVTVPQPRGPQVANDLVRAGLRTLLFEWPDVAPAKADPGWVLA